MNIFKLYALFEEFPFLREIIEDEVPDTIRVKRVDENLLGFTPSHYEYSGSMGRTQKTEKVHFVLNDGNMIGNAVRQNESYGSNYSWESSYETNCRC